MTSDPHQQIQESHQQPQCFLPSQRMSKKQLLLQAGATEQQENLNPPENVKKGFFRKIFGK